VPLIPLKLPPGVYRNGTRYESQGRFYDANFWRWFENTQLPVGGWRLKSSDAIEGKGRAIITWVDNDNQTWIVVGSNEGLFAFTRAGALYNITPVGWAPGPANASTGGGYGAGAYGAGTYGTPRPDTENVIPAMVWTLDTWGEVLIACDGDQIYEWELNTANPATPLDDGTGSPGTVPLASAVFVTEEGAIVALGAAGDPRKLEWCDPEDRYAWMPSSGNLAGGVRLQTQGALVCGKRLPGVGLLHTDVDVHRMVYSPGSPDIYEVKKIAGDCGIVSRQGSTEISKGRSLWQGVSGFWMYNGGSVDPIECEVSDFVFNGINAGQVSKVAAVHNSQFSEAWFFYPSASSIENDRYVALNYKEGHWTIGALSRLSGTDRGTGGQHMMMVGNDGHLFEHEVGEARDGIQPYAESGPIEFNGGALTTSVYGVIPDEKNLGDVDIRFRIGDWTMSPDQELPPIELLAQTDIRFNARRISTRFTAAADKDFRVGVFRFIVKSSSPR